MKAFFKKRIFMLLAFAMIASLSWGMNVSAVQAATPALAQKKLEIAGKGKTFQLQINNKIAKSKYKWVSGNTAIATVNTKGLITSVGKGTTSIRCTITYPTKKTKTLTCNVTVTIPADDIVISNTNLTQKLTVGESYDFNATLTPADTTDQVYWSIYRGDADCIRIDDAKEGKITALKAGTVSLKATAARNADKATIDASKVKDTIVVEVVEAVVPIPSVTSMNITSSNQITIVFDSAVNTSSVIGANNKLSSNIIVGLSKDDKGVLASDPGELTAVLSPDNKTLTITSKNALKGYYSVSVTSGVLSATGTAFKSEPKVLSYYDNTPPIYIGTNLDDSGFDNTIVFSEALNITNMKISNATLITTTGGAASTTTLSTLNNIMNYTISEDKKSLKINLSTIASTDYGKTFSVIISGITDLAGNPPANVYMTVTLYTDTSPKPQARIQSVVRTSYNAITVTFDRGIQTGGWIQIAGGAQIYGVVDSKDRKKVNYTISNSMETAYTGVKTVSVGFWNSYNVISTDISAGKMYDYPVNFTADTTSPVKISDSFDAATGILTLTFNKEVVLTAPAGIISSIYSSSDDTIKPNSNLPYTMVAHTEGNNIIKLKLTGITQLGTYTFTLDQGFVTDNFRNKNIPFTMAISNTSGTSAELPGPYEITQSLVNRSQIYIKFNHKLDKASAENASNYSIAGLPITSAALLENSETGGTVVLTVAEGSNKVEVARQLTIKGVKGYSNSYPAITLFTSSIILKENERPNYIGAVIDPAAKNTVKLNFSEAIQGTLTLKVYQVVGSNSYEITNTVLMNGSTAYVSLASTPVAGSFLKIDVLGNTIADLSGNTIQTMVTPIMISVTN